MSRVADFLKEQGVDPSEYGITFKGITKVFQREPGGTPAGRTPLRAPGCFKYSKYGGRLRGCGCEYMEDPRHTGR